VNGICTCQPACTGKSCGSDGCGKTCGTCTGPQDACVAGQCVCQPACAGKVCGDDGCGKPCGTCPGAQDACIGGQCVCQPSCAGKTCGDNGCGTSCGSCSAGTYCLSGVCSAPLSAKLSAGSRHTCFVKSTGQLYCWGWNVSGQIGDNSKTDRLSPYAVSGMTSVTQVAAGDGVTCALKSDNTMWCWGQDDQGQCGQGSAGSTYLVPKKVLGLPSKTIVQIQAGIYNVYALMSDGTIYAWGTNNGGQLGIGQGPEYSYTPVQVSTSSGLTNAAVLAMVYIHACAIDTKGDIYCWGAGSNGELGNGATAPKYTPTLVPGLSKKPIAVDVGIQHTCGLLADGTSWCWGYNSGGRLAVGSGTNPIKLPAQVLSAPTASALSVGGYHSCILEPDATMMCWGENYDGQVGNGGGGILSVATDTSISNVAVVSAGGFHTCAQKKDLTVWCWGKNEKGQVGIGNTTTPKNIPVQVAIP